MKLTFKNSTLLIGAFTLTSCLYSAAIDLEEIETDRMSIGKRIYSRLQKERTQKTAALFVKHEPEDYMEAFSLLEKKALKEADEAAELDFELAVKNLDKTFTSCTPKDHHKATELSQNEEPQSLPRLSLVGILGFTSVSLGIFTWLMSIRNTLTETSCEENTH